MAHKTKQLKQLHKQKIVDYFYDYVQCNKNQLSEDTGISKTTCTTILKELTDSEMIFQIEDGPSTGGRPRKQYKLNEDFSHFCLINIQNKNSIVVEVHICNLYGKVILKKERYMDKFQLKPLYEVLDEIMEMDLKIDLITVSIPGVVRDHSCIITSDIGSLESRNLDILLGERYQKEVFIENDVNLAVVGYHKEEKSLAFLYQPEKMYSGCGIMINHSLYRGSTLFAGEVGRLASCYEEEPENVQHAREILIKQIIAIICVLNPEKIVVCTMYEMTCDEIYEDLKKYIDFNHLPKIVLVQQLESYIFKGLMAASVDRKRNPITVSEIRKV